MQTADQINAPLTGYSQKLVDVQPLTIRPVNHAAPIMDDADAAKADAAAQAARWAFTVRACISALGEGKERSKVQMALLSLANEMEAAK
jgi:hypothetical protein